MNFVEDDQAILVLSQEKTGSASLSRSSAPPGQGRVTRGGCPQSLVPELSFQLRGDDRTAACSDKECSIVSLRNAESSLYNKTFTFNLHGYFSSNVSRST